jgi:hypothetical protein
MAAHASGRGPTAFLVYADRMLSAALQATAARESAGAGRSWPTKPTRAHSLTVVVCHNLPNCLSHAAKRPAAPAAACASRRL